MPRRRIYFAGAIRGGRDDRELYARLIDRLTEYGEVLTEHVAAADLDAMGERHLDDAAIYERDMAWLEQADALVAEVTIPSLGVGYEIARAAARGLPVLCLFRPGTGARLSAMIAGDTSLVCRDYGDLETAVAHLADFFG